MLEQSEQTPLLDPSRQQTSYNHVQLHYPTTTIQEVIESVRGFANSDADNYDVSDLVTLGGDSAFYATTKVLVESKPDKREMLETSAIKMLDILLEHEYEKDVRVQRILLHEWEDDSSVQAFAGLVYISLYLATVGAEETMEISSLTADISRSCFMLHDTDIIYMEDDWFDHQVTSRRIQQPSYIVCLFSVYQSNYAREAIDASWILGIGSVVVLGFWVAITAINTDKNAWEVLQLLTLAALL
ncbi:hypothetical protein INT43_006277 [Umbelopsis isabellina]|uniref:Uncharacterized protein n=1 Tax=Mortierella isabellina TaxID=91625 RepID=A0A8H7PZT3_MORIS|nr:hypothetical protein INT43_006277 [Umbelopsis isabellina]